MRGKEGTSGKATAGGVLVDVGGSGGSNSIRLLEPCKELAFGSVMLVAAPLALFRIPLVVCPYVAAAGT